MPLSFLFVFVFCFLFFVCVLVLLLYSLGYYYTNSDDLGLKPILRMQKKVICRITLSDFDAPASPLFVCLLVFFFGFFFLSTETSKTSGSY